MNSPGRPVILAGNIAAGEEWLRETPGAHERFKGAVVVSPRTDRKMVGLIVSEVYVLPGAQLVPHYDRACAILRRQLVHAGKLPLLYFLTAKGWRRS